MTDTVIHKDFKTLRQSYIEVKDFIEKEVGDEVLSLQTKIENDLGCAGDDNLELLEKFVTTFKLDSTNFDYSKHFLSEGELFGSGASLLTLLGLPFVILFWLIRLLTFGKINLNKIQFFPSYQRKTLDLTFGDMLTWYLTGKYALRQNTKFKLTQNAV